MLITELRNKFLEELNNEDTREIYSMFYLLLEYFLGIKRIEIPLNPQATLNSEETKMMYEALEKLKAEMPVQYIVGNVDFCGINLKVNENVLIPRPETEELVALIKSKNLYKKKIADIGTGSGCIAIALALSFLDSKVEGFDISEKALELAKINARKNNLDINFRKIDVLNADSLEGEYDVIVSNPPYVLDSQKKEMKKNVLEYEPSLALFVENANPLIFYDRIASLAAKDLKEGGTLFFEINELFGLEMTELLEFYGFENIQLTKDFLGKDRMISANKPF